MLIATVQRKRKHQQLKQTCTIAFLTKKNSLSMNTEQLQSPPPAKHGYLVSQFEEHSELSSGPSGHKE